MNLRISIIVLVALSFLSTSTGSYIYYSTLRDNALEAAHHEADKLAVDTAHEVDHKLSEYHKSAKALAGVAEIQNGLTGDINALEISNTILDHFQSALSVNVCYLMNKDGDTIASSNRNSPDNFLGKNYSFRPYFKTAIQGTPSIYMAVGVTSGKRGIYFSHPVYVKNQDEPSGIVVIKSDITDIESWLFKKNLDGFMVIANPQGVVFASSRKDLLYHTLWKLNESELAQINKSKQLGSGPWKWSGFSVKDAHHVIDRSGHEHHIHKIGLKKYPEWNLIFVHDHYKVFNKVTGPLLKSAGQIIFSICMFIGLSVIILFRLARKDILKRELAESNLRQFKDLINQSNDALFLISPFTGDFLDFNDNACMFLGYSRDEFVKMKISDIESSFSGDNTWENQVEEIDIEGSMIIESRHKKKDGSTFPVEVNIKIVTEGNKKYIVAVARDITERKRMEEELLKSRKLKSIGILAGGIAHDFNNLMQSILGNISFAKILTKPGDKIYDLLDNAEAAYDQVSALTTQLLTFSKGGNPVRKIASLGKLLQNAANLNIRGLFINSKLIISPNLWPVIIDKEQINLAVRNILENAKEALPSGGTIIIAADNLSVDTKAKIALPEGDYVKISIKDNGKGIESNQTSSIFDPYFSTKEMDREKGTGLGLAVCYSIIKKHNGLITVESQINTGTTFHIYLPAANGTPIEDNRHSKHDSVNSNSW